MTPTGGASRCAHSGGEGYHRAIPLLACDRVSRSLDPISVCILGIMDRMSDHSLMVRTTLEVGRVSVLLAPLISLRINWS
jgi:hypothetical protein